MKLILPYPPTVNTYWRHTRQGRHYIAAKGKAFRVMVVAACLEAGINGPATGRLGVAIDMYMPDRRNRDIDNILKALLDALQYAGVYRDDSQIDLLRVQKMGVDRDRPRVEVRIGALNVRQIGDGRQGVLFR